MAWPRQLVLVRNAEPEGSVLTADERTRFDKPSRKCGITERGKQQAEIVRDDLAKQFGRFDLCYTSHCERARQTRKILAPDVRVYGDERMHELERGIWHALTREEIAERYPVEVVRKEREGLFRCHPMGGENCGPTFSCASGSFWRP